MRGTSTRVLIWLTVSLVLAFLAEPSVRAQNATTNESGGWEFRIAPYAWFVSIDGEAATIRELPYESRKLCPLQKSKVSV